MGSADQVIEKTIQIENQREIEKSHNIWVLSYFFIFFAVLVFFLYFTFYQTPLDVLSNIKDKGNSIQAV